MSITLVQQKTTNSPGNTTSQAATLNSGVTQGNLLVAQVLTGSNSTTVTPPAGWSTATHADSGGGSSSVRTYIFYKVATSGDAGATSFTFTASASHSMLVALYELSAANGWPASPLDQTVAGTTSSTASGSAFDSGTTPSTTQGEEVWFANFGYRGATQTLSGVTAGWTTDSNTDSGTATVSLAALHQVVAATGTAHCAATVGTGVFFSGGAATFASNLIVSGTATLEGDSVLAAPAARIVAPAALAGNAALAAAGATGKSVLVGSSALAVAGQVLAATATLLEGDSVLAATAPAAPVVALPLGVPYVPAAIVAPSGYVQAVGTTLQAGGATATFYGASAYLTTQGGPAAWHAGSLNTTIDTFLGWAQSAGLTCVRASDFFDASASAGIGWDDPQVWRNLDYLMFAAQNRGMYVVLDLGAFARWCAANSADATASGTWTPFLRAVAAHYATAPNLAWYSVLSEPTVPADSTGALALQNFYDATTAALALADPAHLVSAGALTHMEDRPDLSWWQAIFALAHNALPSCEVFSTADATYLATVTSYAASLSKPFAVGKFGAPQSLGDAVYSGTPYGDIATSVAQFYTTVYAAAKTAGAAAVLFWNLGQQVAPTSLDVLAATMPATWAVITGITGAGAALPPYVVTIGGVGVKILADAIRVKLSIGQRSTAEFTVYDETGAAHYQQGQPVTIEDGTGAVVFAGLVASSKEIKPAFGALLLHQIACMDWHYLADKRIIAASYANMTCGAIVQAIVAAYLAPEGVSAPSGANILTANQADVESGVAGFTQSGVTIARDATVAWHGQSSLKCVTAGAAANEYVEAQVAAANYTAGGTYTFSFYVQGSGSLRVFCQARSADLALGTPTVINLTGAWQRYSFTVAVPNPLVAADYNLHLDTGATPQAITFWLDGLQVEQAASASAWQAGGGTSTVQPGPLLAARSYNYVPVAQALDDLAQLAGFYWQIDATKTLSFVAAATYTAPFAFDGTQAEDGTVNVERTNPLYRNRQWITGATTPTASQTETRKGDGSTRAFTLSYRLAAAPTVTLNGGGQTVGVKGVDSGKQWYWASGDAVLAQDTGGTILVSTDTLSVTYVGQFDAVVLSQDDAQISAQALREGAGTGYVEDVEQDTAITSAGQGTTVANALLARYGTLGKILTFTTRTRGLGQGQLLTVNLPAPFSIAGEQMLIQDVEITFRGFAFYYAVTAIEGPVNTTWVQFFQALAAVYNAVDQQSIGSALVVELLAQFTLAWGWTMTLTPTVYACPICGPATLCGPSVIVC